MKPKIATARAIAAYTARKALSFATILTLAVLIICIILVGLLAYYASAWWWLLAIPLVFITLITLITRLVIAAVINQIYRHPFSRSQREKLDEFTAEIVSLIEAQSTPLSFYAFITVWDIIRHRDITSVRRLIDTSRSLKNDYVLLEKYFGER